MELLLNQKRPNFVSKRKKDTGCSERVRTQESEIQMKIIKEGMARYPNMLRKLAK
jgi:hypothetical protein